MRDVTVPIVREETTEALECFVRFLQCVHDTGPFVDRGGASLLYAAFLLHDTGHFVDRGGASLLYAAFLHARFEAHARVALLEVVDHVSKADARILGWTNVLELLEAGR